jgi:hypothetical protein
LAFSLLEVAVLGSGPFPDLATYNPGHRPNHPTDLACLLRPSGHTRCKLVSKPSSPRRPDNPRFSLHQLFAPTTYPLQISGMPQHLAAKGVPLGFRNWFYKKSDRHPDQRNLVSPRELPETLAKISRRYGDYQNPASPGRKPFSQKACFYGNAKWRLMHSTYIQSFVPLIARALRKDGRPPDYLYSVIIQEDRLVMNQAPNCYF